MPLAPRSVTRAANTSFIIPPPPIPENMQINTTVTTRLDHVLKEIICMLKAATFTDCRVSHIVLTAHYKQATVGTECQLIPLSRNVFAYWHSYYSINPYAIKPAFKARKNAFWFLTSYSNKQDMQLSGVRLSMLHCTPFKGFTANTQRREVTYVWTEAILDD